MAEKKRTAKPNIRPDWMKKPPKVSQEYAEKRAQIVREWDTWPKATEAQTHRADQRLEAVFNRTMRDEEERARTLQKIEAMNIPKRLRSEVERVRKNMVGSFHDPVAVASVEAFYCGVELQGLFPEFRGQIKGRQNATRANKSKADERKEYARAQFAEIRRESEKMRRGIVIKKACELTRLHFGIRPRMVNGEACTWPNKRTQSDIFKGMK